MGSRLEKKSTEVRKRIESHTFENEDGEEYEPSKFGGFNDYFRRKKIKLQNLDAELRSSSGDTPPIFRGIVAHVNGYTTPSLNDLHRLIVSHGGGFLQYLDSKTMVTHIIASTLTPKKKVEFRKYRIVKPAWVVDSVKAERLLPWDDFRLVDEGPGQKVLGFENGQVVSQTNSTQRGYREQTDSSWYTSHFKDVFEDRDADNPANFGDVQMAGSEMHVAHGPELIIEATAVSGRIKEPKNSTTRDSSNSRAAPFRTATPPLETNRNLAIGQSFDSQSSIDDELARMPLPDLPDYELAEAASVKPEPYTLPLVDGAGEVDRPWLASNQVPRADKRKSRGKEISPSKSHMTAEEHNAELLSDPRMWKSSVVNPDFLKQYYQESRLHHLSTWKSELKLQLQNLTQEKTSSQKARHKRAGGARRYILHVDFDSFFAAVSLRKHPQLVDKPTVVAHGSGPGSEIASCNYPAREFGVKNGMWMRSALQLCPDLKVLPYDFKAYEEASRNFYEAILATNGIAQSVSIDEALVDISALCNSAGGSDGKGVDEGSVYYEQAQANEIAEKLRTQIKERTGCAVSVGIGGNILLAKVALRKAKPAGQHQIKPEEVLDFLGPLSVKDLPGVAYSIGGRLEEIGIKLVREIRQLTKERLVSTLGPKTGEKIWDYSRGIDRTEVGEQVVRKSVSAEVNWGIRFVTQQQAEEFVQSLCDELHRRLIETGVKGRQLTMKVMRRSADAPLDPPKHLGHGKCDTFNKSILLGVTTNSQEVLGKEAISILRGFGFSPGELRGLGVQMTKLEPLKASPTATLDSSQRRLQFKIPDSARKQVPENVEAIEDIDSPQKASKTTSTVIPTIGDSSDIESGKPLNVLGTQFMMPSQVDPAVLAELPEDIRSKFRPKAKVALAENAREPSLEIDSRSHFPPLVSEVPTQSQLDPETLGALPEDVRAEVLAFYANPANRPRDGQMLLPQSPRKIRTAPSSKKPITTPTKKKANLLSHIKRTSKPASASSSTLTQSNFVSTVNVLKSADLVGTSGEEGEISDEFLSALPPDIRREVLENQKRSRLKKRSGLDLGARPKRNIRPPDAETPSAQRRLRLPPPMERPTFTAKKLHALPDLRGAMSQWHKAFRNEGPFDEDVEALIKYLKRVVLDERDLEKAISVVKWIGWLIEKASDDGMENSPDHREGELCWRRSLKKIEDGVQSSIRERGLGPAEF